MRLIDADALINDILTDYGCDPKYIADETIDGLKPYTDQLILERIGLQPTIPASPWHRVEDGLPEIGKIVLVYDDWDRLSICQLDKQYRWLRQGGGWFDVPYVRYWMPIEPPKEDA